MRVDMRVYPGTRDAVHAGIAALRVQGRQIWGDTRSTLPDIVVRLTVGVGDLARLARDGAESCVRSVDSDGDESGWQCHKCGTNNDPSPRVCKNCGHECCADRRDLKKELGNIIFSTIRWVDDLGFDVLECLDLAIEAQEKFAGSGRPR